MAAPKKPTHIMAHRKQYMMIGGKMQKIEQGANLVLSEEQAEALGNRVVPIGSKKAVDLTEKDEPEKGSDGTEKQ